ncbi:MAG TPA: Clp protease N-terminal domain-containing protein [Nocardioidaceae bacterium]|nr:Clp protease N-terminal domain-containing protein [Nocardioidaceae bacterium]
MTVMRLDALIDEVRAHRPTATSPLTHLTAAVLTAEQMSDLGDQLIDHFVQEARAAGASWTEIGACMGVSKQAVQKRHSPRYADSPGDEPEYLREAGPRVRRCVEGAEQEARGLGHRYIGTEHLLLSLAVPGSGVSARLAEAGVGLEEARARAVAIVGRGAGSPPDRLPLTPRTHKTLDLALRAADSHHDEAGAAHLLLALLEEGTGVGAQILAGLASDLPALRGRVEKGIGGVG